MSEASRRFVAEVSGVVNSKGDTALLNIVVSTNVATIIPENTVSPDGEEMVVFTVSRTFRDVCHFAKDLDTTFPSTLLPVLPTVETSQSSVLRGEEQISGWVKWYLTFIGRIPAVFECQHAVLFFTDPRPYAHAAQAARPNPQAKVDVRGNIWGSVSSGDESFKSEERLLLQQASEYEERLSSLMQGEKKYPIPDSSRTEQSKWLRRQSSLLQQHVSALNNATTLLEKHFGERFRKRADSLPPKNSRIAVGKMAVVSLQNVTVGARVVGQRGFQGTVMHVERSTGKHGGVIGVCWDDPTAGNCDGTHEGVKRFHCGKAQGSFEKPSNLHHDPVEDETLGALLQLSTDLDALAHKELDNTIRHASVVTGILFFYSCFLQVASHWIGQLCTFNFTLETAEAWLAAQSKKKNNSVAKELAVEELSAKFSDHWLKLSEEFRQQWNMYTVVRQALVFACSQSAVAMLSCMTATDICPDAQVCETRQQLVALFRQFHLDG